VSRLIIAESSAVSEKGNKMIKIFQEWLRLSAILTAAIGFFMGTHSPGIGLGVLGLVLLFNWKVDDLIEAVKKD
jgi:hypothetical protein